MILNEIFLKVTEAISGQKTPARLSNLSGVSERTLRSGNLTDKTINKIREGAKSSTRNKLKALKWPEREINTTIRNYPQSLCAGIIYECQIPDDLEFPKAIEFAIQCDEIGFSLLDAREQNNLEEFKKILMSSELLDRRYYVNADDEWDSSADPEALSQIKSAQNWADIDKPSRVLVFNMLFSLMACWDIEFYSKYFRLFEPRPLFSLVLPKLDPAVKYLDESTIKKRRGMLWFPIKRLIDLMACLGHYHHNGCWPDSAPKVKDIARMTEEREQELVNWRDGTKRFMVRDFRRMWVKLWPDTSAPMTLFIAATVWQILFVDFGDNKKPKTMVFFDDRYQWWWEANCIKLVNDLSPSSEEKGRWPACFDSI